MFETKFLALIVAAALNPLVVRTAEPHGVIPAECEVSDRAPVTRVAVAEQVPEEEAMPLPAVRPAAATPAKRTTANEIQDVQRALARNDRAAFDAALARAREAGAATRPYDDIARLWDAQFESPFFAEGSEPHRIASSYPGYEAAVRRQVFTDARGRKFYPAAESRAFVASSVGLPGASRATASTTRRASAEPAPTPARRKPSLSTSRAPAQSKPAQSRTSQSKSSKSSSPVARRSSPPVPEASHPIPSAPPRTAAVTEPAPVVPPAVDTSSTEAPPAAGTSAVIETVEPLPTETVAPTTTPVPTTAPATTPAAPAKGRSVILPAILILIGLGVLILLFRTAK